MNNTIPMTDDLKKIKFSIRAIFIFETLMDKVFDLKTTSDFYAYFYSCLLAGKEYQKTFEQFIDDCDNNPDALNWFLDEFTKKNRIDNQFQKNVENDEEPKKKSKSVK